jgi:hypothetical protein
MTIAILMCLMTRLALILPAQLFMVFKLLKKRLALSTAYIANEHVGREKVDYFIEH